LKAASINKGWLGNGIMLEKHIHELDKRVRRRILRETGRKLPPYPGFRSHAMTK
jgi:hypothetical protein